MEKKHRYDEPKIEIINLVLSDIVTSSSGSSVLDPGGGNNYEDDGWTSWS